MGKSWLVCVLFGALAWGQAPGTAPPAQAAPAPQTPPAAPADTSASVAPDAAVITIKGVCTAAPKPAVKSAAATAAKSEAPKASAGDCKTVVTKAEFEKLANGVAPNVTPQLKRQLATVLPKFIAMSTEAKKKGLDKTPQYEQTLKFAKMQILTQQLQRSIQDEAAKVPDSDMQEYYKDHKQDFEQYSLDRLFVPRTKQDLEGKEEEEKADKDEKLSEEQQKAKQAEEKAKNEEAEQAMTKLAETLRGRAAAGEDFVKLQKEAFDAAGMKIESPTVNLPSVRRNGLPPQHAGVFDLKPGEVSQVINDSGGHYIYKVNSKQDLPFDQVKNEIHSTVQNERMREMMEKVNNSFKVETNEAYFGAGGPGAPPPPRMPNSRMAPGPTPPAHTPPPAQPPADKD